MCAGLVAHHHQLQQELMTVHADAVQKLELSMQLQCGLPCLHMACLAAEVVTCTRC